MDTNFKHFLPILLISVLIACGNIQLEKKGTKPISHELFDSLLVKYVSNEGKVDYKGFSSDSLKFQQYLSLLQNNPPDQEAWTEKQQLAYWINAYNAFTIQLVLKHYPLESIKDIGSAIQIPFVNTPWDIKFIEISGEKLDLNNIEHNILRKNFNEPRIHFAIVCASFSCPKLRQEAYSAEKLDVQLTDQARCFLADASKNKIEKDTIEISKIFGWFKGDFTKEGSLISFLNKYAPVKISDKAKVYHMSYDWSLNE